MRQVAITFALLIGLAIAATPVHSSIITFTDRTTWESAVVGSLTNIDFNGIAPSGGYVDFSSSGLDLSGVHFAPAGNTPYMLVVDSSYPNNSCGYPCYNWGTGGGVLHGAYENFGDPTNPAAIVASQSSGFLAAGTNLWTILPDGESYRIVIDGQVFTYDTPDVTGQPPNPSPGFFGFISDTTISSIRFEPLADGSYANLDNFSYASSAVPEPGTLLLLGSGLIGVAGASRFRHRRK